VGGATKLFDFPGAIAEQAHFGLQDHARLVAWNSFLEHIGLIAAFVLAAMITSMRPSISSLSR
jgi:hypothetical protein